MERQTSLADFGKAEPSLSPVFPMPFHDPTVSAHDLQGSGESSAVHRQNISQFSPGEFAGERQRMQDLNCLVLSPTSS